MRWVCVCEAWLTEDEQIDADNLHFASHRSLALVVPSIVVLHTGEEQLQRLFPGWLDVHTAGYTADQQ